MGMNDTAEMLEAAIAENGRLERELANAQARIAAITDAWWTATETRDDGSVGYVDDEAVVAAMDAISAALTVEQPAAVPELGYQCSGCVGLSDGHDPVVHAKRQIAPEPPHGDPEDHLRGHWSNGDPVHIITDGTTRRVAPNLNDAEWLRPGELGGRYAEHERAQREGGVCTGCGAHFPTPEPPHLDPKPWRYEYGLRGSSPEPPEPGEGVQFVPRRFDPLTGRPYSQDRAEYEGER